MVIEKNKLLKSVLVIMSCLCIFFLCLYSYLNFDKYDPSVKQFLNNQDKYEGIMVVNIGDIINKEDKQYLRVDENYILLDFKEKIPRTKFGKTRVLGHYRKPGYIEVVDYRNNNYHFVKYLLSFLGGMYVLFLIIKEWKITKKGLVPKQLSESERVEKYA